jgi:hypothetical protein
MFQRNLLNQRPHFHVRFGGLSFLQRTVKAPATHRYQPTHALDTQAALRRHHFSDLFVDAISPEPLLRWRRASIFCKAPFKKSTSNAFSASRRFS